MLKQLLFATLFAVMAALPTSAQTTSAFKFEPDTVAINPPPTDDEPIAYTKIKNLTNEDITIRWQREVLCIGSQNQTQVCDLNACYGSNVSSKQFTLAANTEGEISLHLINDSLVSSFAVVRLDMWDVNALEPADTIPMYFFFNACVSSTDEPLPSAQVRVFPNPTTDFFALEQAVEVAKVRIFDLNGREVATYDHREGQTYNISQLPVGRYTVTLHDVRDRVFQAQQLQKL
jgi:Secretion system C-terminal sorting domain